MLRSRLIPVLLLSNQALVKTVRFKNDIYLGDPINAVRIFNELLVDELIVLDIDASKYSLEPNFKLIKRLAAECQMPICYGGGITTPNQVKELVALGVEKVSINSAALRDPSLLSRASELVGAQSLVLSIDLKTRGFFSQHLSVYNHSSKTFHKEAPLSLLQSFPPSSFGEVLLQSVDRDGTLSGYDIQTFLALKDSITTPITILGGASSLHNVSELSQRHGPLGCAASSIFLLKQPLRAPLIQYPDQNEKLELLHSFSDLRS